MLNAIELNSNYKNIKIQSSTKSSKSVLNLKDIPKKIQVEADDLINKFSNSSIFEFVYRNRSALHNLTPSIILA